MGDPNCGTFSFQGGTAVYGSVAADGSVSYQYATPSGQQPALSLQITGTVPNSAGGPWSGTYTATGFTHCPSSTYSGSFTATPFAQLNGTYSGTLTLQNLSGSTSSVPATLTFVQGGSATSSTGTAETDALLSASLAVTDSCVTSGQSDNFIFPTFISGNVFSGTISTNDQSHVEFSGNIAAQDASSVQLTFIYDVQGTCALTIMPGPYTFTLVH